jgi:Arc/MetJ family transcription regulator
MARGKTSVQIDEDLLAGARKVLGTSTLRDTIEAVSWSVLRQEARRDDVAAFQELDGIDLNDPTIMAGGVAGISPRAHRSAAEVAGLTVLHYDADFDRVARITGQPVEWVVPRGSV